MANELSSAQEREANLASDLASSIASIGDCNASRDELEVHLDESRVKETSLGDQVVQLQRSIDTCSSEVSSLKEEINALKSNLRGCESLQDALQIAETSRDQCFSNLSNRSATLAICQKENVRLDNDAAVCSETKTALQTALTVVSDARDKCFEDLNANEASLEQCQRSELTLLDSLQKNATALGLCSDKNDQLEEDLACITWKRK